MRAKFSYNLFLLLSFLLIVFFAGSPLVQEAEAFTLNVVGCDADNNCATPVSGFRWLLEEDNTIQSPPGVRVPDSIGLSIHNSHAPVAANGNSGSASSATIALPAANKSYYLSVLPDSGYAMGGTMVAANEAGTVTVKVHQYPIPTAQISVFIFNDNNPINNIYDNGEVGLEGWTLLLQDQGGQMSQDAFGNPLGTQYDSLGNVTSTGTGIIKTCTAADVTGGVNYCSRTGEAFIKNLPPGKYGIRAVPPTTEAALWIQTSTIEGTPGIDAWPAANEPATFIEGFGTGFYHVFIGFVKPSALPLASTVGAAQAGGGQITGKNIFTHFTRPGDPVAFPDGPPVGGCWIGLNNLAAATDRGLAAVPCDAASNFTLNNVPPGNYQLVTWDKPLDALFGFHSVTVPDAGGLVNLGNVQSFRWFGTLKGSVFYDANQNGFRDTGEIGMPSEGVNIRFRDGSMYQATITDATGEYEFSEVFPFFKWLVLELGFATNKPTGMTAVVDHGGTIPPHNGWTMPSFDSLNPQPQTLASSGFAGGINPNTGNNLSRTEAGPVLTLGMQLYLNQTNYVDWGKVNYNTAAGENGGIAGIVFYSTTRAENNPRYAVGEPWEPGIPRVQMALYRDSDGNGVIDDINGIAGIQLADIDNYPLGWSEGGPMGPEDVKRSTAGGTSFDLGDALEVAWTDSWDDNKPTDCIQNLPAIPGVQPCYDNYSTWNQVRPGLFDGGYAFGFLTGAPHLAIGTYIVEAAPPLGYEILKEENKNVDFGDEYGLSMLALPAPCVGTIYNTGSDHTVPAFLTLFPGQAIPAPSAGLVTPLCSMKQVEVFPAKNAAADFFMLTEVPKAGRVVGFANNDLSAEFRDFSPVFGEKAAPAWLPVSFRDWQDNEVARVYADEFGSYNALLPSTFTVNPPIPTGVSPNMITAVLNHPFMPDGSIDPYYNPSFSITPWTLDYWPGKTTYLDTPVVPVAAFAGFPENGPDVEPVSGTPVITGVNNPGVNGPGPIACIADGTETLTITSSGNTQVLNPLFDSAVAGSQQFITRDYGFGTATGIVMLGSTVLPINSWTNTSINVTIPAGASTGQLSVTRGDNANVSLMGITVHVSTSLCANVVHVSQGAGAIQAAIDAASDGDLLIVAPGNYNENVIMYKAVTLQGSGIGSTVIFANPNPAAKLKAWHDKVVTILGGDLPLAMEAPGIMVLGDAGHTFDAGSPTRIDGFRIFGALAGGGIYVYTDVSYMTISNNRISGNQGNNGAGITLGFPEVPANNTNNSIVYNHISRNGGIQGGGGISLYNGSDNYLISHNLIGANFSRFNGGGISHVGLSNNGIIEDNAIIFNEVAFGGAAFGEGAGIFVGGEIVPAQPVEGAGNVTIRSNLIQGNLAGVGNGGGIRALYFNGEDTNGTLSASWHELNIYNNMIVNNVAGLAGGGIALQDAARVNIFNNTIANNDSTATAANAFPAGVVPGDTADSTPQGAGIVSNVHSSALTANTGQAFSSPVLFNNILWNNRSFYMTNGGAGALTPAGSHPSALYSDIWDLQVSGVAGSLDPQSCLLTDTTGYAGTNTTGDPLFILNYLNGLLTALVTDEGGNAITVRFREVQASLGNYHINDLSPALDVAAALFGGVSAPSVDYDGEARPYGAGFDIGADERVAPPPPVLISPDGIITSLPVVFTWNAVTGQATTVVAYRLYITDALGKVIHDAWYTSQQAGCVLGGTCSITPAIKKLKKRAPYVWQVMSRNRLGVEGAFSPIAVFALVKPGSPGFIIPIAPTGTITAAMPTYQWTGSADMTNYQLFVSLVVGGQIQKVIKAKYTAAAAGCAGGGTCSVTPATALANGNYQWYVVPKGSGGKGPQNLPVAFTKE